MFCQRRPPETLTWWFSDEMERINSTWQFALRSACGSAVGSIVCVPEQQRSALRSEFQRRQRLQGPLERAMH